MPVILITGISGTGKSAVVSQLSHLGYRAIDTSDNEWSEWRRVRQVGSPTEGPRDEWVWRDDRMNALLGEKVDDLIFVGGCSSTQGIYLSRFAKIILLTTSPERTLDRLEPRWDLRTAGDRFQRYLVVRDLQVTVPVLRVIADYEIDTTDRGVEQVAKMIIDYSLECSSHPAPLINQVVSRQ